MGPIPAWLLLVMGLSALLVASVRKRQAAAKGRAQPHEVS
jgi:hypothetical protein